MIVKFYLKWFFKFALPFGILMGLSSFFSSDSAGVVGSIWVGVTNGFFFGFPMTLIFGTSHLLATRQTRNATDKEIEQSFCARTIYVQLNVEEALQICRKSLESINGKVVHFKESGEINARTSISWNSFGENISFRMYGTSCVVRITIASKPRLRGNALDHGKNLTNINLLEKYIGEHLPKRHSEMAITPSATQIPVDCIIAGTDNCQKQVLLPK